MPTRKKVQMRYEKTKRRDTAAFGRYTPTCWRYMVFKVVRQWQIKNNDITTRYKVDISELKSQFTEARRQIQLANSEFKAATSGMDDWTKSADGLSAKLKQLKDVLAAQKSQLATLEQQYALVVKEQGEGSKGRGRSAHKDKQSKESRYRQHRKADTQL